MSSTDRPQCDAWNHSASGRVVFLVDESRSMNARVAEGTKSRAETAATAINAMLNRLAAGRPLELAIVGYRNDASGCRDIGCRWAGPLQGRRWVLSSELADAPLAIEQRLRKSPAPGAAGDVREEMVSFPVWYRPTLGSAAPRGPALQFCRDLLAEVPDGGGVARAALIVSIVGDGDAEPTCDESGDASTTADALRAEATLVHAHLGSGVRVPPTYFPTRDVHLPPGVVRTLFREAGVLPDAWRAGLSELPTIHAGARGLIYNARTADLIRLLGLVAIYRDAAPASPPTEPAAATTVPPAGAGDASPVLQTPRVALMLLVDRSSQSPTDASANAPIRRLFQRVNELLASAARKAGGALHAATLSYGATADGATEVVGQLAGPLAGRTWATAAELAGGAMRVDEASEQVPDGIGGLMTIRRRRPIYFDLPPTAAADPVPAFHEARSQLDRWRQTHSAGGALAVVMHCTCGEGDPGALARAAAALGRDPPDGDATHPGPASTLLYHLVQSERPHRSIAYPADASCLETESLRALWASASLLFARDAIAARRPSVGGRSRGMVVNGQFDAFWDGIDPLLAGDAVAARGDAP